MNKVSVVMSTYNGQKYIQKQLESILAQTMQPDEVIIGDDGSSDQTVAIVEKFIKKNKLKNWVIIKNSENKGWKKNFFDLLCEASGDIIFMCDQDDIWLQDKIEVMYNEMKANPEILCLVGKYAVIDGDDRKYETKTHYSGAVSKVKYQNGFFGNAYLGCVLCVSKKLINMYREMQCDYIAHDCVCSQIALLRDGLYIIDRVVILHRIHGENTTCVQVGCNAGNSNLERRIKSIEDSIKYYRKIEKMEFITKEQKCDIQRYICCLLMRYEFLEKRKIVNYIKMVKYIGKTLPVSKYIGDFAYAFGIHKKLGKLVKKFQ